MSISLIFHYDPNQNAVGFFDSDNQREGGFLNAGEGAYGHPLEAFKRAAYGKVILTDEHNGRIVPQMRRLELVV